MAEEKKFSNEQTGIPWKRRILEGLFIVFSILISFFLEDIRQENEEIEKKNELVADLAIVVEEDQMQISALEKTLRESLRCIDILQDDIDNNHQILSDQKALETILCIEIGHSFFPKDGVYAQLVSTGALELIENTALKNGLLELFTHQKERNFATSKEIDNFNIQLRNSMFKNFRIRFDYDSKDGVFYGAKILKGSQFNLKYYKSDAFYGLIGQASLYANMYLRQLSDIKTNYTKVALLALEEN